MTKQCNSFYNMGKSLDKCFECTYCLIKNTQYENMVLPKDKDCPVSVNLFYGDPMLQIGCTADILNMLEDNNHRGKVVMITKGDFSKFPYKQRNLDLHVGFSTFGIDNEMDGGSLKQFEENLKTSLKYGGIKFHIEYRPIIKGVNDDVRRVMELAEQYDYPVAYGGLHRNNKKTDVDLSGYKVKTYRKTLDLIN